MKTFGTAAQDDGVARLDAKCRRIGRYIRPTLINNTDDTERDSDALDSAEPFGRCQSAMHAANRASGSSMIVSSTGSHRFLRGSASSMSRSSIALHSSRAFASCSHVFDHWQR